MPQSAHSLFALSQIFQCICNCERESLNGMLDLVIVGDQCQSEIAILEHLVEDSEIAEREAEVLNSSAYVQMDDEKVFRRSLEEAVQLVDVTLENLHYGSGGFGLSFG
jgi:hypothetical protein